MGFIRVLAFIVSHNLAKDIIMEDRLNELKERFLNAPNSLAQGDKLELIALSYAELVQQEKRINSIKREFNYLGTLHRNVLNSLIKDIS